MLNMPVSFGTLTFNNDIRLSKGCTESLLQTTEPLLDSFDVKIITEASNNYILSGKVDYPSRPFTRKVTL